MPGDHSRFTFDARRRFAGVRMQQGRVQLDADWNEEHDILAERARLLALDVGGPAWLPEDTTPDAFLVTVAGADLTLGTGRLWLDGRLAEIFPGEGVTYLNQPFLPAPPAYNPAIDAIAYLDLWERDVSWAEDPRLLDVALGGIDTTTRVQQVWQVRLLQQQGTAACGVDLDALFPPSAGRLTTQAVAAPAPDDPCILPPIAGYRGIENRLYRVEIQVPGPLGTAKFKWSRDNGSIQARVSALAVAGGQTRVTVNRIGRDEVLRFRIGDWVTLTDDVREFHAEAGQMARIADIDEAARIVTLDRAVPTGGGRAFAATTADHAGHATRLQRWDAQAPVNTLDADGLMTTGAGPIGLEDGVELLFSVAGAGGSFQIGDYWVFAARTANASVEALVAAPPRGIRHQRLQIAAIPAGGAASDCRPKRPHDEGCCTFVVAPGEDIQAAIDKLPDAGGCICLKAGRHPVDRPIDISRVNVHLHGESLGAIVEARRGNGLLRIVKAQHTRVDTIVFRQPEGEKDPMIIVQDAEDTRIGDCRLETSSKGSTTGILAGGADGLSLEGLTIEAAAIGIIIADGSRDVRIETCRLDMAMDGDNKSGTVAIVVTEARAPLAICDCIINDAAQGIIVNIDVDAPKSPVTAAMIRGNTIALAAVETNDWRFGVDAAGRNALVLDNVITHAGGRVIGIRLSNHAAQARGNTIVSRAATQGLSLAIGAGITDTGKGAVVRQIVIADNVIDGRQHGIAVSGVLRGDVRGNSFGRANLDNGVGIGLLDCDDCQVDGNAIAGALVGIGATQGARNRVSGNHFNGGDAAIMIIDEAAATITGNVITAAKKAGIMTFNTTDRTAITGNRIGRCGGEATLATAISGANILGEWQVSDNAIVDTGLGPDDTGPGAPRAAGIFGMLVMEARIESNSIGYSVAQRPPDREDRALYLFGYFDSSLGGVDIGFPAHVHNNSFTGAGLSALVEITGFVSDDKVAMRFEQLLYSGNHHWHWNAPNAGTAGNTVGTKAGATVTVNVGRLTVSGNHVKTTLKGYAAWNLGSRPGPFIGNVSTGPCLDRTLPASQFPAPATAFNLF